MWAPTLCVSAVSTRPPIWSMLSRWASDFIFSGEGLQCSGSPSWQFLASQLDNLNTEPEDMVLLSVWVLGAIPDDSWGPCGARN